ncbi:hypothetical protein C8039_02635 [Halogeometricum sp. wsp3]|nr:hypothetical protein C8039_02635 [Halogeometricum sp. wsp3]
MARSGENFDGTIVDRTDTDTATVTAGVEGNGGKFAFGPPALKISTETTVRWEWTGEGGPHNIVSKGDGPLNSELVAEEGNTYEHTFAETGTYLYSCKPHKGLGMRGAVSLDTARTPDTAALDEHQVLLIERVPIPSISTSSSSPSSIGPTPSGVPVAMTSPGSSVRYVVISSMSSGTENII